MRLPERPVNWREVFSKESEEVLGVARKKDLFDQVKDFNRRYLYWSDIKYRLKDQADRKHVWTFMKILRSEKHEKLKIGPIKILYSLLPDFNKKLHRFDKQLAGNIEIQSRTLGLQKRYMVSSLMEEAIASSIIEGASTTRKLAKSMLREKRKPKTRSERMIANNFDTMQFILTIKDKKLTPDLLLEIQKRITMGTLDDSSDEGAFRDNNDVVVGHTSNPDIIAHVPPDYKKIPSTVKEFCDFANTESEEFIHPVIKGIMLHFIIAYIHPFNDGNGRTARSVYYWYMLSKGYWLFEYMSLSRRILRSRKDYDLVYLYVEYDEMDLTYFIKYNIECIDESLDDLMAYIKKKQREQEETKKIIRSFPELNLRQATILEEFMSNPNKAFTIKEISETFRVVYQTARTDLMLLASKKFISKKISGRTFVFIFNEDSPFLHS